MKILLCVWFILLITTKSNTQDLLGILDGHIFSIDHDNANIQKVADVNLDSDEIDADIAYSTKDCLFYSVLDRTGDPKLISIDLEGQFSEIGILMIEDIPVNTVESIAYNPVDGLIYVSSSLDGEDAWAESILTVDVIDATCSFVRLVNTSTSDPDLDNMCFTENEMYFTDGLPSPDITNFYRIPLNQLASDVGPELIFSTTYQGSADLVDFGERLYYHNLSLELRYLDLNQNQIVNVGQTHSSAEYNGKRFSGMDIVPEFQIFETTIAGSGSLCPGESLVLSTMNLDEDLDVIWSTGELGQEIIVTDPGSYGATINYEGCKYFTTNDVFVSLSNSCGEDCLIQNETLGLQVYKVGQNEFILRSSDKKSDIRIDYKTLVKYLLDHHNAITKQVDSYQRSVLDTERIRTTLEVLKVGASLKI